MFSDLNDLCRLKHHFILFLLFKSVCDCWKHLDPHHQLVDWKEDKVNSKKNSFFDLILFAFCDDSSSKRKLFLYIIQMLNRTFCSRTFLVEQHLKMKSRTLWWEIRKKCLFANWNFQLLSTNSSSIPIFIVRSPLHHSTPITSSFSPQFLPFFLFIFAFKNLLKRWFNTSILT